MRLQHFTQVVGSSPPDSPERAAADAVVVVEGKRLRWRLWNGKAQNAGIGIERIRAVMLPVKGEPGNRRAVAPSRKLWTAGWRIVARSPLTPTPALATEVQP